MPALPVRRSARALRAAQETLGIAARHAAFRGHAVNPGMRVCYRVPRGVVVSTLGLSACRASHPSRKIL
jgi:hypothetical protein